MKYKYIFNLNKNCFSEKKGEGNKFGILKRVSLFKTFVYPVLI